jgi:hypothetical protein
MHAVVKLHAAHAFTVILVHAQILTASSMCGTSRSVEGSVAVDFVRFTGSSAAQGFTAAVLLLH